MAAVYKWVKQTNTSVDTAFTTMQQDITIVEIRLMKLQDKTIPLITASTIYTIWPIKCDIITPLLIVLL